MGSPPSNPPNPQCFTHAAERLKSLVLSLVGSWNLTSPPARIVIKPNWVMHEIDPAFPIRALVTDLRLIEAVIEACLEVFPGSESILVADCPLQSADWDLLLHQTGIKDLLSRASKRWGSKVQFCDFRREISTRVEGNYLSSRLSDHPDPCGYREVELGENSHLEPISDQADRFAVNDYSSSITRSNHARGSHRYLVSQSMLNAGLFINLPKWKSHQKSGITCALKNVVGINGDKAYLPHFRRGAPKWGGDEYQDENRWLYWAQTQLREKLQKRNRTAYSLLKPGWELLKKWKGIQTRYHDRSMAAKNFYTAGGSWHGNETIWRMIYDLNLVIQCCDAEGKLHSTPQRDYFCLVDGLTCGEGNGPLQPLPREIDWIAGGTDPFAIDAALAWFMGFDPRKIPLIDQRKFYAGPFWGKFALDHLKVKLDGQEMDVLESPLNFEFVPPPGWRNHIERQAKPVSALPS